ncbi:28013_t:CDS:1, partial [Gigaspora margarita]
LVILHPDGRVPKTPNVFMIYRKLFVETARAGGYNLPMNIIPQWHLDHGNTNLKK